MDGVRRPATAARPGATLRRAAILLVGAAILGGVVACSDEPAGPAALPAVRCPEPAVPTELAVTCHRVEVDGASLAVAVLHAEDPTGHPVLHLHGGPGGRAVADRHRWLAPRSPLLAHHDVVLVDQRGGGRSTPSLDCPEVDGSTTPEPGLHRACRDRLDAAGIDRSSVTVARLAEDLVAVREALGVGRWHLHGTSYGTRVALELLRTDGDAVASVVLDSVVPPDVATHDELPGGVVEAVSALGRWCTAPARSCPVDVGDRLGVVLGRLADEPATVTVRSGDTVRLDDGTFLRLVTGVLAGPAPHGPAIAARAIDVAATSPAEAAALLLDATAASGSVESRTVGDPVAEGAQLSVECADELPGNDFGVPEDLEPQAWEDRVAAAVRERWLDVRTLCALWGVDPSPAATRREVRSDVPVLVLAGLLDPVTPVRWARHLVRDSGGLADAVLATSGGWSHVPSMSDPCAAALVADFLDDGTRPAPGPVDCPVPN